MPFRRRRSTRFRRRRRGGFRGKSRVTRLARSVRFINKRLTTEVKKADVNVADATLDIAGTVFNLSAIAQGDTSANREGNQIRAKYISCMGTIGTAQATIRIIVIQDTQMTPGSAPTVAQITESADTRTLMNRVSATAGRFNIIYDKFFSAYPGSTGGGSESTRLIKFYKRLDRKPFVKTTWTGATSTDFQNGHFFMLALTGTDEIGVLDCNVRIGFYDN